MVEKRQTAYKIRIGDLLKGNIVYNGDRFSSLEVSERKISRVNIICNIVDKYSNPEKNYCTLTADDGTGQIRIKAFSDFFAVLDSLEIGDIIKAIGWLRSYNDELYILPEIAVRVNPKWAYVRKLELLKEYGEFKAGFESKNEIEPEEEIIEKEKVYDTEDTPKTIILKKIKENKDGIDIEQLIIEVKLAVNEINETVSGLIASGEIYEPRPGFLRSLD